MSGCPECGGEGSYYTEWSDSAEASEYLRSLVLEYPKPPDGTVLIRCTVCSPYVEDGKAEWLIWSHYHNCWWGPDQSGYTSDVWRAGRYTKAGTKQCLTRGSWPLHGQENDRPPEVAVLAPESGRTVFSLTDILAMPALMLDRIERATKRRIAEEIPT